jgi:hypothetical protein
MVCGPPALWPDSPAAARGIDTKRVDPYHHLLLLSPEACAFVIRVRVLMHGGTLAYLRGGQGGLLSGVSEQRMVRTEWRWIRRKMHRVRWE